MNVAFAVLVDRVIERRQQGETFTAIAAALGLTVHQAFCIWRRYGQIEPRYIHGGVEERNRYLVRNGVMP